MNDRNVLHAMQHPMHIHGQRFLVLATNGVPNAHPVWKDTVLVPTGFTSDILLELTNPGRGWCTATSRSTSSRACEWSSRWTP